MADAFALRADLEGTVGEGDEQRPRFQGASFSLLDGSTYNIADALANGGGKIVTDDTMLAAFLAEQPALKRVAIGGDEPSSTSFDAMPRRALLEQPEAKGIDRATSMPVDELRERMVRAQHGQDPNEPLDGEEASS